MIIAKSTPSKTYKAANILSAILCLVWLIIIIVALFQGKLMLALPLIVVEVLLVSFLSYMYFGQITSVSVNEIELLINTRLTQFVIPCSDIQEAKYEQVEQVPFIQLLGIKMFPGGLLRFFSSDYNKDRFYITNDKQVFSVKTSSFVYHISNDMYKEITDEINKLIL